MTYEVWYIPTEAGKRLFKNDAHLVKSFGERDDAREFAYFEYADDPAPDKRDYYKFEIRETP